MPVAPSPMQQVPQQQGAQIPGADKKIAAGLCGILLGGLGIHKFILGYQQEGIILLSVSLVAWIITFVTCGIGTPLVMVPAIIGIVEGIIYLTKSDEDFVNTYIVNKKPWF
jgi:TM2 domain-containing membrane protein YozV